MRVLLLTYHFPPDAEIGGVRPYQIARHLPQFGIEPWVLTVEPQFAESPNVGLLPAGVPSDHILRTPVDETAHDRAVKLWRLMKGSSRNRGPGSASGSERLSAPSKFRDWVLEWLEFPDRRFGWHQPALRAADAVISRVGFDALLSTSPPRVATLVAASLAKRHRLPWVMDLRDPWWGWYQTPTSRDGRSATVRFLQDRLFCRSVRAASIVVHNTERLRQLTCRKVADAASKTHCIPNGCDSDWRAQRDNRAPNVFRIGYYGQVMGPRSPSAFLHGLRLWFDSSHPDPSRIAVRFVGSGFEQVGREVESLGLSHLIQLSPAVPRQEVPIQMAADYVLLLVANAQPLQIPGKAYEYLAAGRRILALTEHDGATADLVKSEEGCVVAERAEDVRTALEHFHQEFLRGAESWIDRTPLLEDLQYPRRVQRFAELLRNLVPRAS